MLQKILFLTFLTLLTVECEWPGPPYPTTVGTGSDVCTQYPCDGSISYPPPSERVPAYYPQQFTSHISGVLVFPFTIQDLNETHFQIAQEGTFHFDWPNDRLKFDNNLRLGVNLTNSFIHTGDRMYANTWGVCFCTNIGIGILNYDAFADAQYLGRENKFVEYIWSNVTADHYLKGPHHIWFDVQTRLPIRAWQPTNGLQVYTNWSLTVDPAVFDIPSFCVKYKCEDTPPPKPLDKVSKPVISDVLSSSETGKKKEKQGASCPYKKMQQVNQNDVSRAFKPKPGHNYKGNTFSQMSDVLNNHLRKSGIRTRSCQSFDISTLNKYGRLIRSLALPSFQELYKRENDRRSLKHEDMKDQEELWKQENVIVNQFPQMYNMSRDGKCHELVMWFVHHLTENAQEALRHLIVMPELPSEQHVTEESFTMETDHQKSHLHSIYLQRIACTACHKA